MNKKLLLFRLAVAAFIILNFIISYKLETAADVFLMIFTFLFSVSYIVAEAVSAFDDAK
jgi:hypothetical protein